MTWQDGEQWLAGAVSGGLPEPALRRWQPLRVGIVNLWEYDNAEFWFADGRLVLRGGNGAGKTKVLELTTLMLLRGEIAPSVLDPFGSQHRTMRFNLLPTGDDDDPRPPSDSGLGYAWVEFGRVDDTGTPQYFVCGLGMSARRGSGTSTVTTWHLVTRLRPGRDFRLAAGDRPLEQKDLKKVAGIEVIDSATKYRARLADELFDLGTDAYDNLTELLKQLRRPKLGERLNPASLAETLRAALPPLANAEIAQLADGWDNLEKLRSAVEDTRTAATRLASFVRSGWLPWARTVVRLRADALTSATTELDNTTKDRRAAESDLVTLQAQVIALDKELAEKKSQRQDQTVELRELLDSQAFQDAVTASSRVESLARQLDSLQDQRLTLDSRLIDEEKELEDASATTERAAEDAAEAGSQAEAATRSLSEKAHPAGLHDSATRHLVSRDVPALRADLSVRRERFATLRGLRRKYDDAAQAAAQSAEKLSDRENELGEAVEQREQAEQELAAAVDTLRTLIRDWNLDTTIARADENRVEDWCDLVAELTAVDPDDLPAARESSPAAAIAQYVEEIRDTLRSRRTELEQRRTPLDDEHGRVTRDLAEVLARTEHPPESPNLWQRRDRPAPESGLGAPLWQCVRPVDGLGGRELDLLEATLAAAGLLDAWISPDGSLMTAVDGEPADTGVLASATSDGPNLTAVLESTPAGGVAESVIKDVLTGIGWHDARPADDRTTNVWLAADGTWRCASLTGRAEPSQPASHLGASAREAARQRTIAALRARLAELDELLASVNERIAFTEGELETLRAEVARAPGERSVTDAVTRVREREGRVFHSERKANTARAIHRENETARDSTWAAVAEYSSSYAFPLHELAAHGQALEDYRLTVDGLAGKLELLRLQTARRDQAITELSKAQRRLADIDRELSELLNRIRQAEVKLRTAKDALGSDAKAQLARREELDVLLEEMEDRLNQLSDEVGAARVNAATAEGTLERHEEKRQAAEEARDAALTAWWETYDAGLAVPVGLPESERRTVEAARESTRAARRTLAPAGDEDRAWRLCYRHLETLRQDLLPNRDARVMEPEQDGAVPRVLVLADSTTGWQAPTSAADLLAEQVRRQEEGFDSEQQRVLTTLLGSTFIEHLKDRLDYTARTFTEINKQLASHPTRHGNAVQLKWDPDPSDQDAGLVVDALAQGYQQLTAGKQETVRSFLARKIDETRADAAAGGVGDWREQLSAALDYRGWLKISLQYRPGASSRWVPFDAAKHGAKSGGEKVVLLSQPLFAAAVVAYNAASDLAPRCVWLDEAMTGVDEEIKSSFMGLTVSFELDVMLTAHDEWCKYPTVPAVAVYDLARHKGLPGVDSVPYLWCGGEWTAVEMPAVDQGTEESLQVADGLFGEL